MVVGGRQSTCCTWTSSIFGGGARTGAFEINDKAKEMTEDMMIRKMADRE